MSVDEPCRCAQAEEHVYDYQHGELSEAECARVRQHLTDCPECEALYTEEETIRRLLSGCGCEEAPPDLKLRVTTFIATMQFRID